jgi:hypothetical protein
MCNVDEELLIGKSVIRLHLVACCAEQEADWLDRHIRYVR